MTSTTDGSSIVRRPIRASRRSLLLAGAAAILIALCTRLAAAPVEGAHSAPLPTGVAPSVPAPTTSAGCWVTGDLVGEANPAEVVGALCGRD